MNSMLKIILSESILNKRKKQNKKNTNLNLNLTYKIIYFKNNVIIIFVNIYEINCILFIHLL